MNYNILSELNKNKQPMKILFCFLFVNVSSSLWSQTVDTAQSTSTDPQNISITSLKDPYYIKGEQELYMYVLYNVKYSDEAKKNNIEGEVTLSFWVNTDSTIANVKTIGKIGYGIDDEVVRLVTPLKFVPGLKNGKPSKMNLILNFPVKAH